MKIRKILNRIFLPLVCMAFLAGFMISANDVYAKDADGNIVIVIDPGHGGKDPGKTGVNGVKECDVNYQIALDIKEELERYAGVRVYLTRPEKEWFTNTGRAMVGRELNADFILCVHNNSGTDASEGALVFASVTPLYSIETTDMATLVLTNLEALGIKNGGVQTRNSSDYAGEDFYTIMAEGMRAGVPVILIEHCFLSNPVDALHVSNEDGTLNYEKIKAIGNADAQAVVSYFGLEPHVRKAGSSSAAVELEKGYGFLAEPENAGTGNISWVSSNPSCVTVSPEGFVKAVNSGNAEIMFSYEDGTTGSIKVSVKVPEQIALVGAVDPTFYGTYEEFAAIDTGDVIANVIYSDGSVRQVVPDSVDSYDAGKVGVTDIGIRYGSLSGSVRVFYTPTGYVPEEMTTRSPELPTKPVSPTEPATEDITASVPDSILVPDIDTVKFDIMMVVKLLIGVVAVGLVAFGIYFFENRRYIRGRRRGNRRRRRR